MINAGVVSCPVYPTNSPPQIHYILDHSESKVVFVENEAQRAKIEQIRKDLPNLKLCVVFDGAGADGDFYVSWADLLDEGAALPRRRSPGSTTSAAGRPKPDDLLAVIYTSGTTGDPKGTMLSHHNAVWTLASLRPGARRRTPPTASCRSCRCRTSPSGRPASTCSCSRASRSGSPEHRDASATTSRRAARPSSSSSRASWRSSTTGS